MNENIEIEDTLHEKAEPEIKEEKGSLFGFVSRLLKNPSKTEIPVEEGKNSDEKLTEGTDRETVQEQIPEVTESRQETNFQDGILNDDDDSLMATIEMDLDGELELETNEHLVREIENSEEPVEEELDLNQNEQIETESENLFEKVDEKAVKNLLQEEEIDAIGEKIDETLEKARSDLQEKTQTNIQENMQENSNGEKNHADNILKETISEEKIQDQIKEIGIIEDPKIQENPDDKSDTHEINDENNQAAEESEVPDKIISPSEFSEEAVPDSEVENEYLEHFGEVTQEGEQEGGLQHVYKRFLIKPVLNKKKLKYMTHNSTHKLSHIIPSHITLAYLLFIE